MVDFKKKLSKVMDPVRETPKPPEWDTLIGLRGTKISELADRLATLARERKEIEAEERELKDEGVRILAKAKVDTCMVGDLRVTYVRSSSSKLSKEKLLELGVSMKKIEAATITTPWTTLKVTAPKAGNGDE